MSLDVRWLPSALAIVDEAAVDRLLDEDEQGFLANMLVLSMPDACRLEHRRVASAEERALVRVAAQRPPPTRPSPPRWPGSLKADSSRVNNRPTDGVAGRSDERVRDEIGDEVGGRLSGVRPHRRARKPEVCEELRDDPGIITPLTRHQGSARVASGEMSSRLRPLVSGKKAKTIRGPSRANSTRIEIAGVESTLRAPAAERKSLDLAIGRPFGYTGRGGDHRC